MSEKKYTALVLGASGLVGFHTVEKLLENDDYETVYAVSRGGIDVTHPKLKQILADFESIDIQIDKLKIDHFFSVLGSTRKKTPNLDDYYQVDYHYPLKVAHILKENGCDQVCLVSAIGANPNGNNFYIRMKGEVERDMIKVGIPGTHILRPSLIKGNRSESRLGESIAAGLFKIIDPLLIGNLKKYRSIEAKTIASAMVNIASLEWNDVHVYPTDLIKEFA